jgi:hypothetical protein
MLVQKFMKQNAWKMKGTIALNIATPLVYMVAGILAIYLIGEPEEITRVVPDPFQISPFIVGSMEASFFGVPDSAQEVATPLILLDPPKTNDDYFGSVPFSGGYTMGLTGRSLIRPRHVAICLSSWRIHHVLFIHRSQWNSCWKLIAHQSFAATI